MATEQGLCALAALARLEGGQPPLYQMAEKETVVSDSVQEMLFLPAPLLPLSILAAPVLPLLFQAAGVQN